jgi:hypothetical protein
MVDAVTQASVTGNTDRTERHNSETLMLTDLRVNGLGAFMFVR